MTASERPDRDGGTARTLTSELADAARRILGSRAGQVGVVALVVAVTSWRSWTLAHQGPLQDFDAYLRGATALARVGDPFALQAGGSLLPFVYPTFAAIVVLPLTWFPVEVAQWIVSFVSYVSLAVVLAVVIAARTGWRRGPALVWSTALGVLVTMVSEPVWLTIGLGQINLPLTAMVVVDVLVLSRRRGGGLLTGLAAGIKLTPAIFVVYFLVTRRYRAAANAALSAAATLAVSLAVAPGPTWRYFADRTFTLVLAEVGATANQSLNGAWTRLLHSDVAARPAWLASSALVAAVGFVAARRAAHSGDEVAGLLLTALVGLLVAPNTWTHYWVWWIVLEVALVTVALRTPDRRSVAAALLWPIPFYAGRRWFPPYDDVPAYDHGFWASTVDRMYVVAGVVALAAIAWRLLATPTEPRDPPRGSRRASAEPR